MEIVPARGRRRRDGRSAASASAFPWEQASATPYRPAEQDVSYDEDDSHDPDHDYDAQYGSPGAYDQDPPDDGASGEHEVAGGYDSGAGDDTSGAAYRYEPERYAFDHDGAGHDGAGHDGAGHDGAGHDDAGHDDAGHDDASHDDASHDDASHDGADDDGADDDGADDADEAEDAGWDDSGWDDSGWDDSGWDVASDAGDPGWDAAGSDGEQAHDTVALEGVAHDGQDDDDGQGGAAVTATAPGRRSRRDGQQSSRRRPSAGRNLPAAIGVGVGLGGLVAASLFIRKEAFVAVVAVAVGLAVWELAQAFTARRIAVPLVPVLVGSLGMVVSGFASGEEAMLVAFALTSLAVLLWRVIDGLEGAVRDVAAGIFTAAYVPFLAGFAMLMLAADDGPARIVVFVLVTVASDVGGYAVGVVAGRHPMAPSVSPKKSWEGLGGSVGFCLVTGMVAVPLLLGGAWWAGALLGLAAVVTATVGDLSESLLKRDLGIKDMGSLLPGHGGMMDRLDSLLPTAPAAYLLLSALVPVAS